MQQNQLLKYTNCWVQSTSARLTEVRWVIWMLYQYEALKWTSYRENDACGKHINWKCQWKLILERPNLNKDGEKYLGRVNLSSCCSWTVKRNKHSTVKSGYTLGSCTKIYCKAEENQLRFFKESLFPSLLVSLLESCLYSMQVLCGDIQRSWATVLTNARFMRAEREGKSSLIL